MNALFILYGKVEVGNSRGKKLGFPTINFLLDEKFPEGIYASRIIIQKQTHNALTFIGAARTYNETIFQAETYVFDFDKNVYGEKVTVSLLKKLRNNQKFATEEALIKQMNEDKRQAEKFFDRQ